MKSTTRILLAPVMRLSGKGVPVELTSDITTVPGPSATQWALAAPAGVPVHLGTTRLRMRSSLDRP
jgi:hypothetical protein